METVAQTVLPARSGDVHPHEPVGAAVSVLLALQEHLQLQSRVRQ
jgi:hypothetical protein